MVRSARRRPTRAPSLTTAPPAVDSLRSQSTCLKVNRFQVVERALKLSRLFKSSGVVARLFRRFRTSASWKCMGGAECPLLACRLLTDRPPVTSRQHSAQ